MQQDRESARMLCVMSMLPSSLLLQMIVVSAGEEVAQCVVSITSATSACKKNKSVGGLDAE